VLPLPTPIRSWTHGIYCDEFAETQLKDLRARQFFGSYIPSCGVGTAFARGALERLAAAEKNRIFEPACLTEDYENGMRLHLMGARQLFLPIRRSRDSFVATREFFPQTLRSAIRQRTRWIMGISLQGWERHGWQGSLVDKYWLWRDRKGLIGNPVSLVTNAICIYGIATWIAARALHIPWKFGQVMFPASYQMIVWGTLALGALRLLTRATCAARIFGVRFALAAPIRMVWANIINSCAAVCALYRYARAKLRGEPLVWLKTEHEYPSQTALHGHRRRLGEVLVNSDYVTAGQLEFALATLPKGKRLGEHLVALGYLAQRDLYDALSMQQTLPAGRVYAAHVNPRVARALPEKVAREWKVLPFKIDGGQLFVAGPELPTDAMQKDIQRFTSLDVRFQLITPENYKELADTLL
jgi:adsorption protein B